MWPNKWMPFAAVFAGALLGAQSILNAQADPRQIPDTASMERGARLYAQYCFMCHQASGQGTPEVFPPLAKSDFLAEDKERSIRILITGLSGAITVRGRLYNNVMPPAPFDDAQLADVLTYAHNSFGNSNGPVTLEQVKRVHESVRGSNAVTDPNPFAPLPKAPEGFTLREVAKLPNYPSRMAGDGKGTELFVLSPNADVWRVDLVTGALKQILSGEDYAGPPGAPVQCDGLFLDAQRRLYVVVNLNRQGKPYVTNEVTIYRTTRLVDGMPAGPAPWFRTSYPWGVGPFNHGVGHISAGPDGFLYVSSGSRTDGNETGTDAHYCPNGEFPITAGIWRLNPNEEHPALEIYARGLRNPYGFCWNDRGEMFATDNGPDVDAPEEMNLIRQGAHYGFPYRFSNWTRKAYAYTPDPPEGVTFTEPIANIGPEGGFTGKPVYTFDPHSSPGGIVYLNNEFPAEYRGGCLVSRFGNMLKCPKDAGFDLLLVKLRKNAKGDYEAKVSKMLSPLARPVDVFLGGPGKVYICEYSRVLDNSGKTAMLPGRLLELGVKR